MFCCFLVPKRCMNSTFNVIKCRTVKSRESLSMIRNVFITLTRAKLIALGDALKYSVIYTRRGKQSLILGLGLSISTSWSTSYFLFIVITLCFKRNALLNSFLLLQTSQHVGPLGVFSNPLIILPLSFKCKPQIHVKKSILILKL